MADSQITKQALAASVKQLMQQKPFSKISVGDIAENCGVNRQTFYYHFRDKYELVNWIYYTETMQFMSSFSDREHWTDGVLSLCRYMQENKQFYINALNTPGQNSFQEYLTQFIHELVLSLAHEMLEGREADEESMEFIATFYSIAFVGLVVRWAQHGMKEDPELYIKRIKGIVDAGIPHELDRME